MGKGRIAEAVRDRGWMWNGWWQNAWNRDCVWTRNESETLKQWEKRERRLGGHKGGVVATELEGWVVVTELGGVWVVVGAKYGGVWCLAGALSWRYRL